MNDFDDPVLYEFKDQPDEGWTWPLTIAFVIAWIAFLAFLAFVIWVVWG